MNKPRIYWHYYPKLKRGFWRVRPLVGKARLSDWAMRRIAYRMVEQMNRAIEELGA